MAYDGYHWTNKPPLGSPPAWDHPLARGLVGAWLFNEGGASAYSLANTADVLALTGNAAWGSDAAGRVVGCPNTGSLTGLFLASPSKALQPTGDVSVVWYGTVDGNGTVSGNPMILGMYHNNANTSPFTSYAIDRNTAANLRLTWDKAGSVFTVTCTNAVDTTKYGTPVMYAGVFPQATGNPVLYRNGQAQTTGSGSGYAGTAYSATACLALNRHVTTTTSNAQTSPAMALIYNRALSAAEAGWLAAEPYAWVQAPNHRRWFVAPAAAAGRQQQLTLLGMGA